MLATDYPLLNLFWTMLMLFLWVAWFFLLFRVFADIFRSRDLGGWGKGLWSIGVIIVPLLGTLIYLIVRGGSMHERDVERAQAQQAAFDAQVRAAAGTAGPAEELTKLATLRDQGVLTDDEFQAQKQKLLNS